MSAHKLKFTPEEAAKFLGITEEHLALLSSKGSIRQCQNKGKRYYLGGELDAAKCFLRESPKMTVKEPRFSFCETASAGPQTPWHIRELTEVGFKFSGGADSLGLCGRKVGWDLNVAITQHHLGHCCKECAAHFLAQGGKICEETCKRATSWTKTKG